MLQRAVLRQCVAAVRTRLLRLVSSLRVSLTPTYLPSVSCGVHHAVRVAAGPQHNEDGTFFEVPRLPLLTPAAAALFVHPI